MMIGNQRVALSVVVVLLRVSRCSLPSSACPAAADNHLLAYS